MLDDVRPMPAAPTQRTRSHRSKRLARAAPVAVKRVYEKPNAKDGVRVLIDRLWPRGLSKARVAADLWLKEAGPSDALRRWYAHDPRRWKTFARKYRAELVGREVVLSLLDELRRRGPLTLLYSAHDTERNNAVVLREVLEERGADAGHASDNE